MGKEGHPKKGGKDKTPTKGDAQSSSARNKTMIGDIKGGHMKRFHSVTPNSKDLRPLGMTRFAEDNINLIHIAITETFLVINNLRTLFNMVESPSEEQYAEMREIGKIN